MKDELLLAIDPGVTSGIAIKVLTKYTTMVANSSDEVWALVKNNNWTHVICENFSTAGRISTYGLLTVRLIGGIQALCWSKDIPLTLRAPQHRYSKQKLANTMAKVIHERDALAHLLSWEASIK